jgi:putative ABC transport system substrate-binding protein
MIFCYAFPTGRGVHCKNPKRGKTCELPVQQVTKFELIINMKTAKTLGISISDNLLSLADEAIE